MQDLENIGCIKKTAMPNGWFELPRPPDELSDTWDRMFMSSFDNSVEMIFSYRGIPVDEGSAQTLASILREKPAEAGEEKLTPQEIAALQVVMGYDNAGNNQYTNPGTRGEPGGPVFDLQSAMTRQVGGRTVLFVKGAFHQGKSYAGILFPGDNTGQKIEEFMIQAPSQAKIRKNIQDFEFVLDRIEWA